MAQVNNQVTTATQTTIANLYISILGRNPEPAGFGFWCDNLADNGNTTAAAANIARGFANSPEFIGTYGGQTTIQAITLMYNNVLDRAPDANGLAFWVGQANALIARGTSVGDAYALTGAAIITTAGTNSSSDTALIVGKQNAAIASGTAAPTATYTMSVFIDAINTTPGIDNIINGVASSDPNNNSFNTGDTVTAGSFSTNTLNLLVAATPSSAALVTLNGIQTVNVRAIAAGTVNSLLFTGNTNFNSSGSLAAVTVQNAALATVFGLSNTVTNADTRADLTINYQAGQVNGAADIASLSLGGNVGSSVVASGAYIGSTVSPVITLGSGIEGVALTTSGTNFAEIKGDSAITTLTVSGSGTNSINVKEIGTALAINAAASTGTNTFDFGAGFSSTDSVIGGSGRDTVAGTISGVISGIALTNVETFRINNASNGTVAFTANPGITTLESRALDSSSQVVSVTNLTTVTNVNFAGSGTVATQAFAKLNLNSAFSAAADSVTVNMGNRTAPSNTYSATLNSVGIETLTFNQTDATAATTTTLTLGTPDGASASTRTGFNSLVFNSAGNISINGSLDATTTPTTGGSLTSINASGVAGAFSLTTAGDSLANGAVITLGAGGTGNGNALTVGAESSTQTITINGGAWVDGITVNAGIFTANLGGGNDSFNGRQATSFSANGGAGNDTITSSLGTDVIIGGTGSDTSVFNLGVAATAQISTVTPAATTSGSAVAFSAGTLGVTIGGITYTALFDTDIATTIDNFVGANAANILARTGVTVGDGTTAITFTGPDTGASFAQPTAAIVGTGTVAAATPTPAVFGSTSASNLTNLDLLTYVNADADIIDLTGVNFSIETNTGSSGVSAEINSVGIATFVGTQPTTLAAAVNLVEAGINAGGDAAGAAAIFLFNNQAYLYATDATTGYTTADLLVALTGINTLPAAMVITSGNIISIA